MILIRWFFMFCIIMTLLNVARGVFVCHVSEYALCPGQEAEPGTEEDDD